MVGHPPKCNAKIVGHLTNAMQKIVGHPPKSNAKIVGRPPKCSAKIVGHPPNAMQKLWATLPNAKQKLLVKIQFHLIPVNTVSDSSAETLYKCFVSLFYKTQFQTTFISCNMTPLHGVVSDPWGK